MKQKYYLYRKKQKKKQKITTFLLFFLVKSSFTVVKSVDTFMGHTLSRQKSHFCKKKSPENPP